MPEKNASPSASSAEKKAPRPFRTLDGYQPTWSLDRNNPPRSRSGVPSSVPTTPARKTTGN